MKQKSYFSKIGLGTVQLGTEYGIANKTGRPDAGEAREILNTAFDMGIDILDTAAGYGTSEVVIGNNNPERFNIVSKWSEDPSDQLKMSLKKLNANTLYGWMAHRADDLIKDPGNWDIMLDQQEKGLVQKIGYSLYAPYQLEALLKMDFIPDIVQVPCNVLDERFVPYFQELKNLGCENHCRSLYLQGLFFMDPQQLPSFFEPIKKWLKDLSNEFQTKIEKIGFLVRSVTDIEGVDKVILGAESAAQLIDLKKALTNSANNLTSRVSLESFSINQEIINPSLWPKM